MSVFRLCAAAGVAALIGVAAVPAKAAIIQNSFSAGGSALDDLNGVAVEQVAPPERGGPGAIYVEMVPAANQIADPF